MEIDFYLTRICDDELQRFIDLAWGLYHHGGHDTRFRIWLIHTLVMEQRRRLQNANGECVPAEPTCPRIPSIDAWSTRDVIMAMMDAERLIRFHQSDDLRAFVVSLMLLFQELAFERADHHDELTDRESHWDPIDV